MKIDQWIHNEILDGLSRLLCLNLDRTPASDLIEGTVTVWCEAICEGRYWSPSLDAPRFQAAFRKLAQVSTKWPSPAEFLAAIPAREQLAIKRETTKASPEQAQRHFEALGKLLKHTRRHAPREPKP